MFTVRPVFIKKRRVTAVKCQQVVPLCTQYFPMNPAESHLTFRRTEVWASVCVNSVSESCPLSRVHSTCFCPGPGVDKDGAINV